MQYKFSEYIEREVNDALGRDNLAHRQFTESLQIFDARSLGEMIRAGLVVPMKHSPEKLYE